MKSKKISRLLLALLLALMPAIGTASYFYAKGATAVTTSYANTGGQGDRTAIITGTTDLTFGNGAMTDLYNGAFTNTAWFNIVAASGKFIRFDFGTGKVIDECTWTQSSASSQGTWKWQGSNDASSWTDIGSSFSLGNANPDVQTSLSGNTTSYRYYQLLGVSGSTTSGPTVQEVEFKISP